MKRIIKSALLGSAIMIVLGANAQISTPMPSPKTTVSTTVGLTDVELEYSRPGSKGREVFGMLVPYDKMWRTGANASTKIHFNTAVKFGDIEVDSGQYAIYTIPGQKQWEIILHKNLEHWGIGKYEEAEDIGRMTVPVQISNADIETFTIDFSNYTSEGAMLNMMWQSTKVSIPISVDIDSQIEEQIASTLKGKEVKAGEYYKAARYYLETEGKDLQMAYKWIKTAVEKRPEAFWYLHQQAKIENKLGLVKEAIVTAQTSMKMAKVNEEGDYGYIKNNQDLIDKIKSGE